MCKQSFVLWSDSVVCVCQDMTAVQNGDSFFDSVVFVVIVLSAELWRYYKIIYDAQNFFFLI